MSFSITLRNLRPSNRTACAALRSGALAAASVSALSILVSVAFPAGAAAQTAGLFPEPFVAEHHLVQSDADGSRFESEPVTDWYGGSWIVSVRPDGSRLVVDLAARELTEIRPDRGTYWTVSFDRLGTLAERVARAERRAPRSAGEPADGGGSAGKSTAPEPPVELVVEELGSPETAAKATSRGAGGAARHGAEVRRLRVVEKDRSADPGAGMEVWVDPSIRLRPAALEALARFEAVLGKPRGAAKGAARPTVDRYLATARVHAAGAMTVRTVRTLGGDAPASARVRLEDVTTRLERVDDFPEELVAIPEGLRRIPHPLEGMAAFLEAEAERDRALSGAAAPANDGQER